MIRWDLTKKEFRTNEYNTRKLDWVITECDYCFVQAKRKYAQHKQTMKKKGKYLCCNCATKSPEFKQACSQRAKQKWKDQEYRINNLKATHSEKYKNKLSKSSKEAWGNEERRRNASEQSSSLWENEEYRNKIISKSYEMWTDEKRKKQSQKAKELWKDEEYRKKITNSSRITSKRMWEKNRDELMKIFSSEEFKNKIRKICSGRDLAILDKISKASKEMWNDDQYRSKMISIMSSEEFKQKMSKSIKNSDKILFYLERIKDFYSQKFKDTATKLNPNYSYQSVNYRNNKTNVEIICDIHGIFEQTPNNHINKMTRCPRCAQSYGRAQGEVFDFVKGLGFDLSYNDRTQISPLELDIYISKKKFAIEFHGLYWHSYDNLETTEERNKHNHKYDLCKEKGIRLIQIFENEWRDKREIMESIISNKFGKSNRIFARKCEIKKITSKEHVKFMGKYHIQGGKGCHVAYGLFYQDELVVVMSFNKHKKYGWEITRFANKLGLSVVGGASRLFKKFILDVNPNQILTYADRRYSNGNLYKQLGFKLDGITKPNYYYIKNNKIHSRQQFQKHKLKNKLEIFNPELTEAENMFNNGYRRLWDAGNFRFVWFDQK